MLNLEHFHAVAILTRGLAQVATPFYHLTTKLVIFSCPAQLVLHRSNVLKHNQAIMHRAYLIRLLAILYIVTRLVVIVVL